MATVQENATLADVKAIETEWNAAIDTEYAAVVAKYPDIDFDAIDPQIISLAEEIEEVHPTTNEPLVWVMNKKTLSKVLQPREVINAIRKKGFKVDVEDAVIKHNYLLKYDHHGFIVFAVAAETNFADEVNTEGNTVKGLTSLLADTNKVHIKTHDDGRKEVIQIHDY